MVEQIKIPLPSVDKQKVIAAKLKKQILAISSLYSVVEQQIRDTEAYIERKIEDCLVVSQNKDCVIGTIDTYAEMNPSVRYISKKLNDNDLVSFVPMPAMSAEEGAITDRIIRKCVKRRRVQRTKTLSC